MAGKIIVISESPREREVLDSVLSELGYEVVTTDFGIYSLSGICNELFQLVICDIREGGPRMRQHLSRIRHLFQAPILGMTSTRLALNLDLDVGAEIDHFIFKPFQLHYLEAHVQFLIRKGGSFSKNRSEQWPLMERRGIDRRRSGSRIIDSVRLGSGSIFRIVVDARDVYRNNEPLNLTPKEFMLFRLFIDNFGEVVSDGAIIRQLWPRKHHVSDGEVRQYVYRLRRKIEADAARPKLIVTVKGIGYRFVDDAYSGEETEGIDFKEGHGYIAPASVMLGIA